MISNPNGMQPLLDSVKLRELADCLNGGSTIEQLVERWSFNNSIGLNRTNWSSQVIH